MSGEMDGKVVLFTGGTDGLGRAGALELARRGARLALVARSPEKGERVAAEIRAASGAEVELLLGDLASLAEVRAVAERFRERHDRLDVLVNNAGAIFVERGLTVDGFERTFAINHLAPFLLTNLLLDRLRATPGARVVSTASGAHLQSRLELARVAQAEQGYKAFPAYADSKLCNILFTRELHRREGPALTASCFHPGFVGTNFGANNGGFAAKVWTTVGHYIARSPEKGAETLVWLASSPEAASVGGGYFKDRRPEKRSKLAQDDDLARELWELSARLCGVSPRSALHVP